MRSRDKKYQDKHYVDIGFLADWKKGEPKVIESEKCMGWNWYSLDNLPEKFFAATEFYFQALKREELK